VRSTVPLTPADIHNREFGKATLGKRGYDEEQVDALLDEVSMEMINLLEENADLLNRSGAPVVRRDDGAAEAQLHALAAQLDRARQACDQAQRRADALQHQLRQARTTPAAPAIVPPESVGRVLAMAQHTADQHLSDARRESEELLDQARQRSGRLVHEAAEKAGDIERDARRRHDQAVAELETQQAGALRDIGEMTTFAEDYQAALQDHIVRQQHHLSDAPQA
jgi:DivIVA domain-containing protein